MNQLTAIKETVKEKYGQIAREGSTCGCGTACCGDEFNVMADDYSRLDGYQAEADLGLGCGLPTEFAHIRQGDTVIDLGSGAGNDVFVARALVGEKGKLIGIDITEAMVARARSNATKLGFTNVEFIQGDIEEMPVADNLADVIVSNCVLNLVPDKQKVIAEIFRTLKPGGHFSISDIVLKGDLPDGLKESAEMYAGCVSGAIQKSEYLEFIHDTGFKNVTVQKEKRIVLPDNVLLEYIAPEALQAMKRSDVGIYSLTVYAEKPGISNGCCGPECCN